MEKNEKEGRIKIEDLPMLEEMSSQEQKGILGGRGGSAGSADSDSSSAPADVIKP